MDVSVLAILYQQLLSVGFVSISLLSVVTKLPAMEGSSSNTREEQKPMGSLEEDSSHSETGKRELLDHCHTTVEQSSVQPKIHTEVSSCDTRTSPMPKEQACSPEGIQAHPKNSAAMTTTSSGNQAHPLSKNQDDQSHSQNGNQDDHPQNQTQDNQTHPWNENQDDQSHPQNGNQDNQTHPHGGGPDSIPNGSQEGDHVSTHDQDKRTGENDSSGDEEDILFDVKKVPSGFHVTTDKSNHVTPTTSGDNESQGMPERTGADEGTGCDQKDGFIDGGGGDGISGVSEGSAHDVSGVTVGSATEAGGEEQRDDTIR